MDLLPRDRLSDLVGLLLKTLAVLALLFIVLGMAGPHTPAQQIEKVGEGAQLVLTIDRSSSMDEPFSGALVNGHSGESKAEAARRLITDFVNQRKNDMFGMVTFSNSAMYVMPLTQSREAILAAVDAAGGPSLFQTNIGSGLTSALAMFAKTPDSGSRALILISDGGGRMGADTQEKIRDWLERMHITVYWIVLREPDGLSIFDKNFKPRDDGPLPPEIELNQYFQGLDTEYHAYEADDPKSLALAIEDINRKEKKPIRYVEQIPGRDYTNHFFALAALMIGLLLGIKLIEVKTWR
ncbi:von Willebrand factor type A domain protein [mine drainage metagenome]|uniref:von Willebrand factor type A domain protein n=1 Tax=mine drainage metagenome TaxID=410659 RepID=A0A1J5PCH1_9ZZZZ